MAEFKILYKDKKFYVRDSKNRLAIMDKYTSNIQIPANFFRGYHITRPNNWSIRFNYLVDNIENQDNINYSNSCEKFKEFIKQIRDIGSLDFDDCRYSTQAYIDNYKSRIQYLNEDFTLESFVKEFKKLNYLKEQGFNIRNFFNLREGLNYIKGEFNLRKDIKRLVLKYNISIDSDFLDCYYKDKDFLYNLILKLEQFDMWEDFSKYIKKTRYDYIDENRQEIHYIDLDDLLCDDFYILVNECNYDMRSTLEQYNNYFGIYENIGLKSFFNLLRDYASMMIKMKVNKFKKFPKFLKSVHDITAKEYSLYKTEWNKELFKENVDTSLEFQCDNFIVLAPQEPKDLYFEGEELEHCVASYVDRIINNTTQILFLREEKDKPLVTIEIKRNKLIQAQGYARRGINKRERKYLEQYAREKNLQVCV